MAFKHIRKGVHKNIQILEKEIAAYNIPAPDRNRADVQIRTSSDAVTDEYIAMDLFLYFQEHIENLLSSFYSSCTNDSLRKQVKAMATRTIGETDLLVHYLRVKGWLGKPPMMKPTPSGIGDGLTLAEAASLFDHLTYRYDTMYLTSIFASIVHDLDFKIVLELGLTQLNKQIDRLEKELKKYAVPFPKRPAKFTLSLQDIRFFDDDTIFRTLNSFMQGAAPKHTHAFKQTTYNDAIRELFKQLLIDEMDLFDDFLKLGKLKGWLNPMPQYVP